MMSTTIHKLQTLFKRNYDAERGYETVAQEVSNDALRSMFASYSRQRHQFHTQIAHEIKRMGGNVDKETSAKADLPESHSFPGWLFFCPRPKNQIPPGSSYLPCLLNGGLMVGHKITA